MNFLLNTSLCWHVNRDELTCDNYAGASSNDSASTSFKYFEFESLSTENGTN